jgi:hypothetical protein
MKKWRYTSNILNILGTMRVSGQLRSPIVLSPVKQDWGLEESKSDPDLVKSKVSFPCRVSNPVHTQQSRRFDV